jgi:hypothetical protein
VCLGGGQTVTLSTFPLRLMAKHLYTFEKQKINLFNNIFQDICIYSDYYRIITVNSTCQKSLTSKSASAIHASSHSRLSYYSASHFDFQRRLFEGPGSSSINSTSRVANSVSPAPSDIVKLRLWCPSFLWYPIWQAKPSTHCMCAPGSIIPHTWT